MDLLPVYSLLLLRTLEPSCGSIAALGASFSLIRLCNCSVLEGKLQNQARLRLVA